jgi:hypothetical protein
MSFFIPKGKPEAKKEVMAMKPGARRTMICFIMTIATGVSFHQFLHLPPFMGMMCGLGYLMFTSFYMKRWGDKEVFEKIRPGRGQARD